MRYESLGRPLPRTFEDPPKPSFTVELKQKDIAFPYANRLQTAHEELTRLMYRLDTSPINVRKLSDSLEWAYRYLRSALPKNHTTLNMPIDYIRYFNRMLNVYNQIAKRHTSDGFHFVLPNNKTIKYFHAPSESTLDELMAKVAQLTHPVGIEFPALCLQIENHTDVEAIYLGATSQQFAGKGSIYQYHPTVSYRGIGFKQIHKGSPNYAVTPSTINISAYDKLLT